MTTAIVSTILFFPLYLLIREPFRRLPLHIDTGFYVSNHTIARKRFDFSKGWNAHYAGCSKVVPEIFYSLIYLLHGREGYARWSRIYASVFNYATAIVVGLLTCAIFGFDTKQYLAGLTVYALLSSEPHWGVYFECGEMFHVLTDAAGVLMLMHGVNHAEPLWVGAGAFTFVLGACFIKLSAVAAFVVLFGGTALAYPSLLVAMAVGAVAALAIFAAWVRWNGQSVLGLRGPLRGHEREFAQGNDWAGVVHRLREKAFALLRAIRHQPLWMVLVVVGFLFASSGSFLFWMYAAGCLAAYVFQATDCRYYLIPLLPALAVLAGGGVVVLLDLGAWGMMMVCLTAIAWLLWNPIRAWRLTDRTLNLWCWSGGIRAEEADRNFVLQQVCSQLRNEIGPGSVLVYGPRNQTYALLGASYETPIVAPEVYLDQMIPSWQKSLNRQLIERPPEWIVDTGRCFRAGQARIGLGLDYRISHVAGGSLQVYRRVAALGCRDLDVKTFAPLTIEELEVEKELAGDQLTIMRNHADESLVGDCGSVFEAAVNDTGEALSDLLGQLKQAGHTRLAIYGAGRFTVRHADVYRRSGIPIAMVLDDRAGAEPQRCGEWPVCSPGVVDPSEFDAVVISSDRFARTMMAKLRRRWGDGVAAFVIPGTR